MQNQPHALAANAYEAGVEEGESFIPTLKFLAFWEPCLCKEATKANVFSELEAYASISASSTMTHWVGTVCLCGATLIAASWKIERVTIYVLVYICKIPPVVFYGLHVFP